MAWCTFRLIEEEIERLKSVSLFILKYLQNIHMLTNIRLGENANTRILLEREIVGMVCSAIKASDVHNTLDALGTVQVFFPCCFHTRILTFLCKHCCVLCI